ncbi:MAG: flagellar basal body L-ring protein FlgH [Terriglobales bacterium]
MVRNARKNCIWACLLALPLALAAQKNNAKPAATTPAEQALASYLARVRQVAGATTPTLGSLWTPGARYTNLSTDFKAQNVNDLITIHIIETTQAAGSGSVQAKRQFNATSGFSGLFGTLPATSRLQALVAPNSNSDLEGTAATASTTALTTSLTGRVVDLLPNGFLVVEAVRTIAMNNQQQTVIVHGVVRPADIAPDNSVLSTQVGDLEVDLQGKGVISDTTRPVGGWVRLLLKFLSF